MKSGVAKSKVNKRDSSLALAHKKSFVGATRIPNVGNQRSTRSTPVVDHKRATPRTRIELVTSKAARIPDAKNPKLTPESPS